jgi:hypothetical protein
MRRILKDCAAERAGEFQRAVSAIMFFDVERTKKPPRGKT